MGKVHMSAVAGLPVRTLRRIAGIRAHAPSPFNACIGAELKGGKFTKPAAGTGGQRDIRIRNAFKSAVNKCKK